MIFNRKKGIVADWWFEDRRRLVSPTSRTELHQLLEMCQSAALVLEVHDLFRPSRVIFEGWLRPNPDTGDTVRVEEPDVTVAIPQEIGSRELVTYCEKALDKLEQQRSFLYPIDLYMMGAGVVLDADGQEQEQPDVTWLWGKTLDAHIVNVCTQSDAWLPYTLLAQPQPAVWKLNAPRLEAALQEIQNRLGILPYINSHSDHAVIDGFRLSNHTDCDDEVLPTYW
ncbi:hypothetical protein IC235_14805 [Hymenobacter sp. BT664]|uniref:Uncharacterized protein n=1 Tax=Hymenobacter montanus TaxID=2771359 RepID=A0A927BFE4_9BACT|nr:hypothetical protein [Hymenobacter montanus]MBD2769159.1 hypothetical protein [Hymenobacter montanus]